MNTRGVSIVLDDFGTGYSSLDHLRRLPIGELKIDRNFIAAVPFNRKTCAIVHAVGQLAATLDLSVVAEGVETEFQLDFLRQARFELGQGHYFARPEKGDALLERLSAASPLRQDVA